MVNAVFSQILAVAKHSVLDCSGMHAESEAKCVST